MQIMIYKSSVYENALQFVSLGISTIPLGHHDKRPEAQLLPNGRWEVYKTTLPKRDDLNRWFHTEYQNYGVIAGWNNLVILDFDNMCQYARWTNWIESSASEIIKTKIRNILQIKTHRGVHVYVKVKNLLNLSNRKLPGIDLKINGYVVGPGSIHPSGDVYRILKSQTNTPSILSDRAWIHEIDYLSDIFPASILEQVETSSPTVPVTPITVSINNDPWANANTPIVSKDLVSVVRAKFKIEDFFAKMRGSSPDGRWFMAPCPFHDDQTPSFWIDTKREICNCNSCSFPKPLDVIDLYAALYGMDNRTALFALAAKL
jgi:hypothetical protein